LHHSSGSQTAAVPALAAGEPQRIGETIDLAGSDPEPRVGSANSQSPTGAPRRGSRAIALTASSIRPRRVAWLWPERIPFGELTILAGDPGLGKSLLAVDLAAKVTGGHLGKTRNVLMLTAEDSPEHTVRPRLEAAGANLERVIFGSMERDGVEGPFVLPTDNGPLSGTVAESDAGLVVVDPLAAHLAVNVNSWKDQEVRAALAPLGAIAQKTGAAVLVVAHLNKGQGDDPLQRLGGSIGIPAAARSVLLLTRDPDDPEGNDGNHRVLAHVKSNLGRLATVPLPSGESLATARLMIQEAVPYTGAELLAAPRAERGERLREAVAFLQSELAQGERPVCDVKATSEQLGISPETLQRAKQRLGVKSQRRNRGWAWMLQPPAGDENA
jgi:AAA domain